MYTLTCVLLLTCFESLIASDQTQVSLASQSKNIDFGNAQFARPFRSGKSLPKTCTTGEMFFKTDVSAGANSYGCVATNTWVMQGGSTDSVTNIKDYGAVCDGLTDDTAAISSAITAASGKTLYSPDGTCIHQPITLSTPLVLEFSAASTWKLKAGSTGDQLTVASSSVVISGGTFDGNVSTAPGAGAGIVIKSNVNDVTVQYLTIKDHATNGVLVSGSNGNADNRIRLLNNIYYGSGSDAVSALFCVDCEIGGGQFLFGSAQAIQAVNSERFRVHDSLITGYTGNGVHLIDTQNGIVSNNQIVGSAIAVLLDQSSNCGIEGNQIPSFTGPTGIWVTTAVAGKDASRNRIVNNNITISQTIGAIPAIQLLATASGVATHIDNTIIAMNIIQGQTTLNGTGVDLENPGNGSTIYDTSIAGNQFVSLGVGIAPFGDIRTQGMFNIFDPVTTAYTGNLNAGQRFDAGTYVDGSLPGTISLWSVKTNFTGYQDISTRARPSCNGGARGTIYVEKGTGTSGADQLLICLQTNSTGPTFEWIAK